MKKGIEAIENLKEHVLNAPAPDQTPSNGNIYVSWKWLVSVLVLMLSTIATFSYNLAARQSQIESKCDLNTERYLSVSKRIDRLELHINTRFDKIEAQIEKLDEKIDKLK